MTTATDGTTEWVLPRHLDEFKSKGAKMFGKPVGAAAEAKTVKLTRKPPGILGC